MTTRRDFLRAVGGASAVASFTAGVPSFLLKASAAAGAKQGERALVVVQLSGGNDGLNTVVPFGDDAYYRNRYTLGIAKNRVLKIDDYLGLHPSLDGLHKLLDDGKLSIVQGVGYPNPNRSHFASMDIWHTARRETGPRAGGWLGRSFDRHIGGGGDMPALHFGEEQQPLALAGDRTHAASVRSLEAFELQDGGSPAVRRAIESAAAVKRPGDNDLLEFLQSNTQAALISSRRVQEAVGRYQTPVNYPSSGLAEKLKTVAQLIDAELTTRVYYVALGGFDTHSDQAAAHAGLLNQLSGAVSAFVEDVGHHGHGERVMVMAFSEFGRRVKENASRGTDHGAAAPMFLAGDAVKEAVYGRHPSLTELDDGDLKFQTDFRQVYATLLENWLGWESEPALGGRYERLPLV